MILETQLTSLIPVTSLRTMRKTGLLRSPEHWQKQGHGIAYTEAGMAVIREQAPGVLPETDAAIAEAPTQEAEATAEPVVTMRATVKAACVNPKYLRAFITLPEGNRILASVRLSQPTALASRFRVGSHITVMPDTLVGSAFQCSMLKA